MATNGGAAVSTTRPNRREEQRAQTRLDLLDAAARVFAERGYHGASVDLVAEAAGYTKGAVYSNFDSKEDLFLELLDRRIDTTITAMETLLFSRRPRTASACSRDRPGRGGRRRLVPARDRVPALRRAQRAGPRARRRPTAHSSRRASPR